MTSLLSVTIVCYKDLEPLREELVARAPERGLLEAVARLSSGRPASDGDSTLGAVSSQGRMAWSHLLPADLRCAVSAAETRGTTVGPA
jgi:hypothetical protein